MKIEQKTDEESPVTILGKIGILQEKRPKKHRSQEFRVWKEAINKLYASYNEKVGEKWGFKLE